MLACVAEKRTTARGVDPRRLARLVRRLILPVALLCFLLLYLTVGFLRVPRGMDTMPEIPGGSLCVIDKRSGSVQPGIPVLVDLEDGSTLLSRVIERDEDRIRVRNDNDASRLPDSDELGWLSLSAVRGSVLAVFAPDGKEALPRDR